MIGIGEGNGTPLQYSCLENPTDGGACYLFLLPPIPPSIRVFSNESTPHEVAKVLEFQLQHQSFQRNPRADLLQNGLVGSPHLLAIQKVWRQ